MVCKGFSLLSLQQAEVNTITFYQRKISLEVFKLRLFAQCASPTFIGHLRSLGKVVEALCRTSKETISVITMCLKF